MNTGCGDADMPPTEDIEVQDVPQSSVGHELHITVSDMGHGNTMSATSCWTLENAVFGAAVQRLRRPVPVPQTRRKACGNDGRLRAFCRLVTCCLGWTKQGITQPICALLLVRMWLFQWHLGQRRRHVCCHGAPWCGLPN